MKYALVAVLATLIVSSGHAQTLESLEARIDQQQRELDALRAELAALRQQSSSNEAVAPEVAVAPGEESEPEPLLLRKSGNGELRLSGRIHRAFLNVNDGLSTTGLFVDSDQGPTMLRLDGTTRLNDEMTLSGTIEYGIQNNRSFRVSQDSPNPGTDVLARLGEVVLDHKRFGKFSFGRGFAAAWLVVEQDMSGTFPAAMLPVGMIAPSLKFADSNAGQLTDIRVNQYFIDTERLLLTDRFRYDSPMFAGGAQLSASVSPDSRWDAALRYYPESTGDFSFRSTLTYQHKPFAGIDDRVDVGLGVRHNKTGLSLTASYADSKYLAGGGSDAFIIKGGWATNLVSIGETAFAIDYAQTENVRIANDKAESIGIFAVQKWPEMGLDFYGGYRLFDVDRSDVTLKKLDLLALGIRYSF